MRSRWVACGVSCPSAVMSEKSGLAGCVARNWRMRVRVGGANGVAECRPMPCSMVSPSGGAVWGLAAQRERLAVMDRNARKLDLDYEKTFLVWLL